nr:nucleoside-diphosphate sugar epimerase/dehydratase [Methylomarinum sp. Ch1-1]MDP4522873.1 nucleoside-diphosphate sugar epimerase/dehydratase [Methylomarinum sp. Ch1-1]
MGEYYVPQGNVRYLFVVAPFVAVPIFIKMGLYRAIIRYIGGRAFWTIVQATTLYGIVFSALAFQAGIGMVPRTVPPLNWLIMLLLVSSSRFFARWWLSESYARFTANQGQRAACCKKNVVIYGAGSAGVQLASALAHGREFNPVAFIDDDPSLHRQKINNLRIYPLSSLDYLIERHHLTDVLLAIPSATRARRNEIIRLLEIYPVHVRSMPGMADIAEGRVTFDTLQEVDIADLLGRDPVEPDQTLLHANITDKVVMVTGAGGSIGSELCRQIISLKPTALVLYELSEFALYAIEKELLQLQEVKGGNRVEVVAVIGSVTNNNRIKKFCQGFRVQTIYHAAAYKHVPIMERNPCEAIANNVLGTLSAAQAAIEAEVETFVLISTDKAVRPTNTMGATKRFAELILQALSLDDRHDKTRFTMVRFGNVLGSSGSVIPLFREQIAKNGPVTVTDPRIIRYFMTIPEASQLVIQAGAMGRGGDVFVLDMGEPVRIMDLARRMIHLSGLTVKDEVNPNGDIEIELTGLRPGEKLYEELLIGDNVADTQHPRIMRAEEEVIVWEELQGMIARLEAAVQNHDVAEIREILQQGVSGYTPQCDICDWLWLRKG